MNFLAHCLIAEKAAGDHSDLVNPLIAGGMLGDFIKGPVPSAWPDALQGGVRLHRHIDAYSNVAPGIRQSCRRFPPELRRMAPIFVDIVADHCLALDWVEHHRQPLVQFSARCGALTGAEAGRMGRVARRHLQWVIDEDLLAGYAAPATMERGLCSITRRLGHQHLNAGLLDFVAAGLPSLHADFRGYFPLMIEQGRRWVQEHLGR